MNIKIRNHTIKIDPKAILCVAIGTAIGLGVYAIFLRFNIAIYGWNLGLIFAPLAAGYAETMLANRLVGEGIGAISAFILFIDTTFYSFILKNPTLGCNFITAGSIIVILQAAFPTLINYILLVVVGGIASGFAKQIKKIQRSIKSRYKNRNILLWEPNEVEIEEVPVFDETESNRKLNSLDFYFITGSDMKDKPHELLGVYQSEVIIGKETKIINIEPEKVEQEYMNHIKEAKDKCLIKIAKRIQANGGNGILDLSMNYSVVGNRGDNIQISAVGIGILLNE